MHLLFKVIGFSSPGLFSLLVPVSFSESPPTPIADLDSIQASTETVSPHCGTRIEPKDYIRVD